MFYNLINFIKLISHAFSANPESLRYFNPKRIARVLVVLPLMLVAILFSRICLMLDEILFSGYRKMSLDKSAFIISIPRSGTTYLYKLLADDSQNFHCFKLWELAFAPSILQKSILRLFYTIDQKMGGYIKSNVIKLDKIIFGDFVGIHDMGLNKPEEDEALFFYNLSSVFLRFLVPEVKFMDDYLYFDTDLPERIRKDNMNFYYRLVQRHKYFFDRHNSKYFLSKNPAFVSKIASIGNRFPNAKFLIPSRSPLKTIPSTISLNKHIYNVFCRVPNDYPLRDWTRELIVNWYLHLNMVVETKLKERSLVIDYNEFINDPVESLKYCYKFIGVSVDNSSLKARCSPTEENKYISFHEYPEFLGLEDDINIKKIAALLEAMNSES